MATQSDFPMDYAKVPTKQRCGIVRGTILKHRTLGDIFIACIDDEKTEKAFNRLSPKSKCDPSLFQNMVVFLSENAMIGDEARDPPEEANWEVMATAPKDGTEVLILVANRAGVPHKTLVGHYMAGGHCIEDHPPIAEGWYFWNGRMFDKAAKPLLWAPLPLIGEKAKALLAKLDEQKTT